jgi:adenine/guanine/hypoxanthine permease
VDRHRHHRPGLSGRPPSHAYAVALGLIPAIAAWGLLVFKNGLLSAGMDPGLVGLRGMVPQAHVGGLYALSSGFILVSMGLAAMGVMMIEGRLRAAAGWAWALAFLSFFGVVHAWNPQNLNQEFYLGIGTGWRYALAYTLWGMFLFNLQGKPGTLQEIGESRVRSRGLRRRMPSGDASEPP